MAQRPDYRGQREPKQPVQLSPSQAEYLQQLKAEKDNLDPAVFLHAHGLLNEEIDRVEKGHKFTEIHTDKKGKLTCKVLIPSREYPKFNFVGQLLGPKGNTMKALQSETGCKMSILGKGSTKDRKKEEEMRATGDPKFDHLGQDLHVLVEVWALPMDAHTRMAGALTALQKFLIPEFTEEIRQIQYEEMMYINGEDEHGHPGGGGRGRGRGGPPPPGVGRGGPRGPALLATPPPVRTRGGPPMRGLSARPRGAPVARPVRPVVYADPYEHSAYEQPYEYEQPPAPVHHYAEPVEETQYFDYGQPEREPRYGNGYGRGDSYSSPAYGKAPPPGRAKPEYARPYPYSSSRGAPRY